MSCLSGARRIGGHHLLPRAVTLTRLLALCALLIPNKAVSKPVCLPVAADASTATVNLRSVLGVLLSSTQLSREKVIVVQEAASWWTRLGELGRVRDLAAKVGRRREALAESRLDVGVDLLTGEVSGRARVVRVRAEGVPVEVVGTEDAEVGGDLVAVGVDGADVGDQRLAGEFEIGLGGAQIFFGGIGAGLYPAPDVGFPAHAQAHVARSAFQGRRPGSTCDIGAQADSGFQG